MGANLTKRHFYQKRILNVPFLNLTPNHALQESARETFNQEFEKLPYWGALSIKSASLKTL
ncbi:hypothetical protein NHP21005_12400 [Helicobacter sp. NHP21005]|nr:hypothetical protein NHP21005_12400 [Helicobacter sp. NHP21005]